MTTQAMQSLGPTPPSVHGHGGTKSTPHSFTSSKPPGMPLAGTSHKVKGGRMLAEHSAVCNHAALPAGRGVGRGEGGGPAGGGGRGTYDSSMPWCPGSKEGAVSFDSGCTHWRCQSPACPLPVARIVRQNQHIHASLPRGTSIHPCAHACRHGQDHGQWPADVCRHLRLGGGGRSWGR